MPVRRTTAGSSGSADAASAGSLITPLIVYALLSLVAATRRSSTASERAKPAPVGARPGTGAFGNSRSTDEPRLWQEARARQPGRGREATSPWHIPWQGWKDIFWRTYPANQRGSAPRGRGGVVFYSLACAVSRHHGFRVVVRPVRQAGSSISDHLSLLANLLPSGALDIVQEQIERIASKGETGLGVGFAVGLAVALWSANAGVKAIMDALNVVEG